MDDLTDQQWVALQKFKEHIKDVAKPDYDDRFCSRWLIARDFDVKKAEKMFRQSLIWRRKYNIDNIMDWKEPDILKYYHPTGFHGEARDGTIVYYFLQGRLDIKRKLLGHNELNALYYGARRQDFVKLMARNFTYASTVMGPIQSAKHGKRIDQMTLVYDFEGMSTDILWKPYLDIAREGMQSADENFPETIAKIICINVPWFFPILWNIAKPLINQSTRDKIAILGSDWKSQILEYIEADQLPVTFGGTAPDPPGPREVAMSICWGGKIPDEYKNAKPELDLSKFTTQSVSRGSDYHHDVIVSVAGSVLEWQFYTEDHDIGFGVYKRTQSKQQKKETMEELIKCERVNSHKLPEDGSLYCESEGTYVVIFDNSYSWTKGKTVAFFIEVLEPTSVDEVMINKENSITKL